MILEARGLIFEAWGTILKLARARAKVLQARAKVLKARLDFGDLTPLKSYFLFGFFLLFLVSFLIYFWNHKAAMLWASGGLCAQRTGFVLLRID